ncbi:MAG: glycerol-3-phosphate dehydrogenase/oxidase [Candidatus Promineifilaceae bacterium]
MWSKGWRDTVWAQLDRPWDVIVIGGGITGAGIFREAARVGLRVLLVEARDFGCGTSSRSSKLVHGGLRYLKNAQLKVTMESVGERERLLDEGRGLVQPLGFVYASFKGDKIPPWVFGAGLAVYDVLGLKWGHKQYDNEGILHLAPHLTGANLKTGFRYFDAQTDDARLTLRVIREGVTGGGVALNYAPVVGLLRQQNGQVCGVRVRDQAPANQGRMAEAQAAVVINATGAWADELRQQVGGSERLRQLRGSHLVFAAQRFPLTRAISYAHPTDQRPVFAIPWEGVTLFGTTDVDHKAAQLHDPGMSAAELDYLLTGLAYAFPELALGAEDVVSTFAGIRPVINTGKADPSKESREHVLWREAGLLTVAGGKLTTFRVMAHDALNRVRRELPGKPTFRERDRVLDEPADPGSLADMLQPGMKVRLGGRYGRDLPALLAAAAPAELTFIADSISLWAELRWAARAEGVVHLDDLLLRRVRLGLLLPRGGLDQMAQIRAIVQPELGWDDTRWQQEEAAYRQLWQQRYYLPNLL